MRLGMGNVGSSSLLWDFHGNENQIDEKLMRIGWVYE